MFFCLRTISGCLSSEPLSCRRCCCCNHASSIAVFSFKARSRSTSIKCYIHNIDTAEHTQRNQRRKHPLHYCHSIVIPALCNYVLLTLYVPVTGSNDFLLYFVLCVCVFVFISFFLSFMCLSCIFLSILGQLLGTPTSPEVIPEKNWPVKQNEDVC